MQAFRLEGGEGPLLVLRAHVLQQAMAMRGLTSTTGCRLVVHLAMAAVCGVQVVPLHKTHLVQPERYPRWAGRPAGLMSHGEGRVRVVACVDQIRVGWGKPLLGHTTYQVIPAGARATPRGSAGELLQRALWGIRIRNGMVVLIGQSRLLAYWKTARRAAAAALPQAGRPPCMGGGG